MRHGKKFNHLSRPVAHRKALLVNQAKSLFLHKRIVTTVAKAKALRQFVEPIITKAKQDSTHARRMVFSHFQDKIPVKILFNEIVERIGDRPGGYTRIIRLGKRRLGDNAETCIMELVDYNYYLKKETSDYSTTHKSTRRGRKKSTDKSAISAGETKTVLDKDIVTTHAGKAGAMDSSQSDKNPTKSNTETIVNAENQKAFINDVAHEQSNEHQKLADESDVKHEVPTITPVIDHSAASASKESNTTLSQEEKTE